MRSKLPMSVRGQDAEATLLREVPLSSGKNRSINFMKNLDEIRNLLIEAREKLNDDHAVKILDSVLDKLDEMVQEVKCDS
jgi:hypothetical protein